MTIYRSKIKRLFLVFLAIIMVLISITILFVGLESNELFMTLAGGIGSLFFAACLIVIVKELFSNKPILIFDEEGFYDKTSITSPKRKIMWNEVKDMDIYEILDQKFIAIWLKNPEIILEEYNKTSKSLYKMNKSLNSGDININIQQIKKYKLEDVFYGMYNYWLKTI